MEDKALLSTEEASGAEKAELLIVIPAYNEAENIERIAFIQEFLKTGCLLFRCLQIL